MRIAELRTELDQLEQRLESMDRAEGAPPHPGRTEP
jgi:hypothetical protein